MKKIFSILILLLLNSCDIQYDGETKIVFKGRVLEHNNSPIANKEIKVFVNRETAYLPFVYYYPSESNFIGLTKTDANGYYTIVIPKPTSNYSDIIVEINDNNNNYNSKQFINIKDNNFFNYELNLNTIKLYKKEELCNLNIIPNQVNPENELLEISLEGEIANEITYLNLPIDYNYHYETIKKVLKNQVVILKYKYKNYNTNSVISNTENISIGDNSQLDFNLNY